MLDQARLVQLAADGGFMAQLERVSRYLDDYQESGEQAWFGQRYGQVAQPLIAYFSLEFGLTESLMIFAGGLGILSGDHLKSSSDLDVPLLGVGLLYQQGYFRQYLNQAGWQQEAHEFNHFDNLPLTLERDGDGEPLIIDVQLPGRVVWAQIWRVQVGRVPLYLLDTNVPHNTRSQDRDITDQLYGGDQDLRIKQEIMLGIGGHRALKALGLDPTVYHMNEGHASLLTLELLNQRKREQEPMWDVDEVRRLCVFTTHTPVPAGHDQFSYELVGEVLDHSIPMDFLKQMGGDDRLNMTLLALNLSQYVNGVAKEHGKVFMPGCIEVTASKQPESVRIQWKTANEDF